MCLTRVSPSGECHSCRSPKVSSDSKRHPAGRLRFESERCCCDGATDSLEDNNAERSFWSGPPRRSVSWYVMFTEMPSQYSRFTMAQIVLGGLESR